MRESQTRKIADAGNTRRGKWQEGRRFGIFRKGRKRRKEKRREERMNEGKKKKEGKERKERRMEGGWSVKLPATAGGGRRWSEMAGSGRRRVAKAPSPTNGGATLVEMVKMEF